MNQDIYCFRGHMNPASSAFCSACGARLGEPPSEPGPASATPLDPEPTSTDPVMSWVPPANPLPGSLPTPPAGTSAAPPPSAGSSLVPPPYRVSTTDAFGDPAAQDRQPTNRLLVVGSLLGLFTPVVVSILEYLAGLVVGYGSSPALFTGYLGVGNRWSGVFPKWYGQYFGISAIGILALVACGAVLIAALAHASWARPLAIAVAALLLPIAIADGIGMLNWPHWEWSSWVVTFATLAIELAIPVLLLVGALRPQVRHDRSGAVHGAPVAPGGTTASPQMPIAGTPGPTNGMAIAALVLSIIGLVTCLVGSIVGLVLGYVSRNQMQRSRGAQGGAGLATASIVIGWAGVVLAAAAVVVYAVLLQ